MPNSGDQLYDVFLSYSHKDRDKFGMEYIERIKAEIEKALEPIITDRKPRVFLDAEALQLGDHWHSRIMECLHQCKAVVCLVSEEYLKSEYCTRERLWWNAKQTHAGRFLDGPYPVYFVKLEKGIFSERREVKDMMAVQTDPLPWFEVKEKLQEEFIRERLAAISTAVRAKVSAAKQAEKSFCSVLPTLNENFVGRVTELRELHELCVNGNFPVLQAAGGVGKTELSVAYAYGFADRYPMGRFLFRMERVMSWDEAFAKALEMDGTDANGRQRKVSGELKIDDEILEKKDPAKLHRAAAEAFLERAAKGKLLILMDNLDEDTTLLKKMRDFLCGSPIPENIHILATTRGTFRFSEREKFQSYELKNLKEDEAFEMLCLTGNGQYPFDRQPPSAENPEYRAAHELICFLDGHAWSMEIVSAFMADNYDSEGFNFAMELESLRKNHILSSESGVTYRAGESSATSVELLRPTLDKLEKLELGAEMLELAVFAACFDPDEIPLYLLKDCWNLNFPGVTCSKGVPFIYAVNQLVKYHLLRREGETCRMHRLVQAVFLSRKEKYLPHIIETLPKCLFIPAKYWVSLLLQNPELADICPQDGTLSPWDWVKLLVNPAFAARSSWYQWLMAPSFNRFDPDIAEKYPWLACSGNNAWSELLAIRPEYASRNPPWGEFEGADWGFLLEKQPQFADKCDWEKLDGQGWSLILMKQPQFADKCDDWGKLNVEDWVVVLSNQPQLAKRYAPDWSKLDGWCWSRLLSSQPQFADECDNWSKWEAFAGADWVWLLKEQPQFAGKCDVWAELDGSDWADLLKAQPQFADRCDWKKLDGQDWSGLLAKQPRFADRCDLNELDGDGWGVLLGEQPQFADRCVWRKLDGQAWVHLLSLQPQFADKCSWSKLDGWNWAGLLSEQPQFADKCVGWNSFEGMAWAFLLAEQPQFADRCDWEKLLDDDKLAWPVLLDRQPRFAEKCDWNKFEGGDWAALLQSYPQFSRQCDDWSKLNGRDWSRLLRDQPQFAEKCDLSRLGGEERKSLLEKFPELFGK